MAPDCNIGLVADGLYEIYRDYDAETPLYCRVLDSFNDWVLVDRRGQDGERFGVALFKLSSIWRVRESSIRVKKIFEKTANFSKLDVPDGDMFLEILKRLESKWGSVTFYCEHFFLEACAIGNIAKIDAGIISIYEYRPIVISERAICSIRIEDVTRVEAGGEYEARLLSYYNDQSNSV